MSRSTETTEDPPPTPKKKRRKKKKPVDEKAEAASQAAPKIIPGAGTADGDKLREALRAFDVGNYAFVRARWRELEHAKDPEVRKAALDLFERTRVDPAQIVAILACVALTIAILYVWVF